MVTLTKMLSLERCLIEITVDSDEFLHVPSQSKMLCLFFPSPQELVIISTRRIFKHLHDFHVT